MYFGGGVGGPKKNTPTCSVPTPFKLRTSSVPVTPYTLRTKCVPSVYNPRRKTLLDSDWSRSFWTLSLLNVTEYSLVGPVQMPHLVLHRHGIVYPDNAHVECRIFEQRVIPNEVKPTVTMLHVFQCSLITTAIIVIVVFSVVRDSIQILNYSIEFRLGNVIFISLTFDVVQPA